MVIEDAAAPFNKFAVQRLHALNAADDEHPLAAQIERGATLVAVPAATGPAGISRHARQVPLLKASPSLLEQRVDQFALALEALRQRRKRLPQVLVFRFKFRAPDFPQRRGRLIHGVQFGFQAVAFVPERGVFLRKRTPALFRLLHAAARSRFALLQQPDTVGLLLVLAFQFNDKPPDARLFLRDAVHGHVDRAVDRATGFIRKPARGRRPQKAHILASGERLLPLREKILFTQKPQRGGLTLILPAEQLAHLPGQRVFRSGGIDEQFVHFKRRQFNRRKRHFLQEMFLFGKRDPHADKRTSEQFVRFPYAVNSP